MSQVPHYLRVVGISGCKPSHLWDITQTKMKHFIKTMAPFLGTIVFGLMNIFCAFFDRAEAHPQLLYFGICACIAGLLGLFTFEGYD